MPYKWNTVLIGAFETYESSQFVLSYDMSSSSPDS
jgi:hypothetical protein